MKCLFLIFAILAVADPASAQRYADLFSIDGIDMDVKGPTAEDARVGAFREAAKKGWAKLWDKLVDPSYKGQAPHITDGDVYRIVSAIDVSSERMSATRYIARFTITFDPGAMRSALARAGAGYTGSRNRAMLLMPWLVDGGVSFVYDTGNPWAVAWAKFPLIRSQIDYIRADGTLGDAILLNPHEARARNPERVQTLLNRYRADGIVVAKAVLSRSAPGGPVHGTFYAFSGSNPYPTGTFELDQPNDKNLADMFNEAISRMDTIFSATAKKERPVETGPIKLGRVVSIGGERAQVSTPDAASIETWTQRLRNVRTVASVTVAELAIGGTSRVRIAVSEGHAMLLYELDQAGLHMEADGYIRNKLPGDAPIERPKSTEEIQAGKDAAAAQANADTDTPGAQPVEKKSKLKIANKPPSDRPALDRPVLERPMQMLPVKP